jgi:sirohydrochlorin cobaltochelatase
MKTIIVLAMHGIPPNDFPKKELAEFFKLHSMVENTSVPISTEVKSQHLVLDEKIRNWPRNEQNDPFHSASYKLAEKLNEISGYEVIVGYNEFCYPSIDEALKSAASKNPNKIIVVTPMMTRGGDHSEKDIPTMIVEFKKIHPGIEIVYAWPFNDDQVARFLIDHVSQFFKENC